MKKLNKKGMTLIEVVVAMFILAVAGSILTVGFTTVIRTFTEANEYKEATNAAQTYLASDNSSLEGYTTSNVDSNITIKKGDVDIGTVSGTAKIIENNEYKGMKLFKFNNGNTAVIKPEGQITPTPEVMSIGMKVYTNYCDMMTNIKNYLLSVGVTEANIKADANDILQNNKYGSPKKTIKNHILDWYNAQEKVQSSNFNGNIKDNSIIKNLYLSLYGETIGNSVSYPILESEILENLIKENNDLDDYKYAMIYQTKNDLDSLLNKVGMYSFVLLGTDNGGDAPKNVNAMFNPKNDSWYYRSGPSLPTDHIDWYNNNGLLTSYENEMENNTDKWTKIE